MIINLQLNILRYLSVDVLAAPCMEVRRGMIVTLGLILGYQEFVEIGIRLAAADYILAVTEWVSGEARAIRNLAKH